MTTNEPNPLAYLDRDRRAWTVDPTDGHLTFMFSALNKDQVERDHGPLVPLWPEGKVPQTDAYVWTQGDDEDELLARLVEGAHVTVKRGVTTYSGRVAVDDAGWTVLGTEGDGVALVRPTGPFSIVSEADRITVVPPPEPVLPEWATYTGEWRGRMVATTPDGMVWVVSRSGGWMPRYGGSERITPAELIARGGRLLIDHNGRAVEA